MLWRETEGDPVLRQRAFAGLSRYQQAVRPPPPPAVPVTATAGSTRLLHYGTENIAQNGVTGGAPVIFVPSLINPPTVLDLSESQSMLRNLAARGHNPWLVDWGTPAGSDTALDLTGHVQHKLMPLIASLGRPAVLVGYCLGGTLAIGAAAAMGAVAVVTIATPWDFNGFPEPARAEVDRMWTAARPACERLGYVPMEVLQSGFWAMDPARTIRKYSDFGEMEPGSDGERAFLALEDWANDGPPLTHAAGRFLFDRLYKDNLTGSEQWIVGDTPVVPSALLCPTLSIRSSTDRIVPAASAPVLKENWTLDMGHVGMIVGGRAQRSLWAPLSEWLSKHGG
jgi:polyhydroxyalkanoate synthase